MPQLVEGNVAKNPPSLNSTYERVLEVDLKLREVVSTFPAYLKRGEPEESHWPSWVQWARSTLTISAADKVK
jgi:hypothetical protein